MVSLSFVEPATILKIGEVRKLNIVAIDWGERACGEDGFWHSEDFIISVVWFETLEIVGVK